MDAAFQALGQYNWFVGTVYAVGAHVVDAPKPRQATVYKASAWGMRTTQQVSYNAPTFKFKHNALFPTKNPQTGNYGAKTGQAPTSGIYTGIPSGCGPKNGMASWGPYS